MATPGPNASLSAGAYQPATLSGVAFVDANGNGVKDTGESGLSGGTVTGIVAYGNSAGTATAGAGGGYSFTNLAPGTFTVQFDAPSGYLFDGSSNELSGLISVTPGQSETQNAAAYSSSSASSVSGVVWVDADGDGAQGSGENGLSGVTVTLLTASGGAALDASGGTVSPVTTGSGGSYSFTNLTPGSYTVQFAAPSELPVGGFGTGDVVGHGGNARPNASLPAAAYQPATLSGVAFVDANGNGVKDTGEWPLRRDRDGYRRQRQRRRMVDDRRCWRL